MKINIWNIQPNISFVFHKLYFCATMNRAGIRPLGWVKQAFIREAWWHRFNHIWLIVQFESWWYHGMLITISLALITQWKSECLNPINTPLPDFELKPDVLANVMPNSLWWMLIACFSWYNNEYSVPVVVGSIYVVKKSHHSKERATLQTSVHTY